MKLKPENGRCPDCRIKSDLIHLRFKAGWNMQQIADEYDFRLHFVENVIREALRRERI